MSKQDEYAISLDDVQSMLIEHQKEFVFNRAIKQSFGQSPTCNYEDGSIRQEIFSCRTCQLELNDVLNPASQQLAEGACKRGVGVCACCATTCHAGHDLVEVSTKRSFRCDCPTIGRCTMLTSSSESQSTSNQSDPQINPLSRDYPLNINNVYNHNYAGSFCTCNQPYRPEVDQMIQCIVCEDWFHFAHVNLNNQSIPAPDSETSPLENLGKNYICQACAVNPKSAFLVPYWRGVPRLLQERRTSRQAAASSPSTARATTVTPSVTSSPPAPVPSSVQSEPEIVIDPATGWKCNRCSFVNKPADSACFGCEATKPPTTALNSVADKQRPSTDPQPPVQPVHSNALQESSDEHKESEPDIPCTRLKVAVERLKPAAMLVDARWSDWLCRCKECIELLQRDAPWVLIDEDEAPYEDDVVEIDEATFDAVVNEYLERQPRSEVLSAMEKAQRWTNMIMTKLRERVASSPEQVVTTELIQEIISQISSRRPVDDEHQDFKRQRTE